MHRRAREHIHLVVMRKRLRRRRRNINSIPGGLRNYLRRVESKMARMYHSEWRSEEEVLNDVHRDTAARMFHKKPEDVTDAERRLAKTINYGIMFGGGYER